MRRLLAVAVLCLGFVLPSASAMAGTSAMAAEPRAQDVSIPGGPTSQLDRTSIKLDARLYIPATTPAPAVILAHGFGGSKESVAEQAAELQAAGYVVVAYSARGFGKTIAPISMNSPEFEVADAQRIVDYLADLKSVEQDSIGDPRVGVAGGSYGGALALLLAGYDQRIDAVVSDITWNSLVTALFPQYAISGSKTVGVFKQMWTSYFFSVGMATPPSLANPCGRFSIEWCLAYQEAVTTGQLSNASKSLMQLSSPASITNQITAPTLLMAGEADSLFPLTEADATYQQISAAHPETPLKMVWHAAGHDGGIDESVRLKSLTLNWFDKYLANKSVDTSPKFTATLANKSIVGSNSRNVVSFFESDKYPGVMGAGQLAIPLTGKSQKVVAPAGGQPALMTVLPGLGGSLASLVNRTLPNQSAVFTSKPFQQLTQLIGASQVRLMVSSPQPLAEMTLFASLRILNGDALPRFPNGLVAPIKLQNLAAGEVRQVLVELPAVVAEISPGEQLQLVVSTTDAAYKLPLTPGVYELALADNSLQIPNSVLAKVSTQSSPWSSVIAAAVIGLILYLFVRWRRPAEPANTFKPELADVPLAVENLVKEFKGGQRAVNDVTWSVPKGVVLGLLGPNGAGKTTTMRIAMGLILPTEGSVYVYGHQVQPGSPVLARIGALIEGAGFLHI